MKQEEIKVEANKDILVYAGMFESKINNNFERWWKKNATAGRHWENKEGFRKAFFEGRISGITKQEKYKELKDVLKGCTDSEFTAVVDEILNCLRVEMDKRKTRIERITSKCQKKKHK